jgi:hypothetical protein
MRTSLRAERGHRQTLPDGLPELKRWIEAWSVGVSLVALGLLLLPDYLNAIAQGQLTHCQSNLRLLATALEMYSSDNFGRYPIHMRQLLRLDPRGAAYLRNLPTCPSAGTMTYGKYLVLTSPDTFTLCCQGTHHARANPQAPPDWPEYILAESQAIR